MWPIGTAGVALLVTLLLLHRQPSSTPGPAYTAGPGAPLAIRLAEATRRWLGPQPVAILEDAWYGLADGVRQRAYWLAHRPATSPTLSASAPTIPAGPRAVSPGAGQSGQLAGGAPPASVAPAAPTAPAVALPSGWPAAPGEGVWQPVGQVVAGHAAMERTFVLPDPQRPYARVELVWIDPRRARLHLVAGTQYQALAPGDPPTGEVPPGVRPVLLAAFNGGFQRLADHFGSVGFRVAGAWLSPPTSGMATVAVDAAGRATLGAWGNEIRTTPTPADLRQNLPPILDHDQVSAHIDEGAYWGVTVNNAVRVWRSGLGQTADGALVYAAGTPITARGLAEALQAAGARRAMELDINSYWVTFNLFSPDPAVPGALRAAKLTAAMTRPATRYLTPDARDFFYLTAVG